MNNMLTMIEKIQPRISCGMGIGSLMTYVMQSTKKLRRGRVSE